MLFIFCFFSFLLPTAGFFIGASTSSYQIEGHNRGISIWDVYTEKEQLHPVGNATNHFLYYKDDIRQMNELGIKNYRMSISWTRIMPVEFGIIDPEGISFYHNIFDECLKYNITPFATLYHWDLPEYLDRTMGGWLSDAIIFYFLEYSKIIFKEYGKKVRHWFTINEPLTTSLQGYGKTCNFAPGRCSEENQFISARNQLLAHAYVGNFYKSNYEGDVGIVLNSHWIEPIDKDNRSQEYADIQMQESFGLFMHPLFWGEYPPLYKNILKPFNAEQKYMLQHSYTMLGLNHYTTYYVDCEGKNSVSEDWIQAQSSWLFDEPRGLAMILQYIAAKYSSSLPIYITECGFSQKNDGLFDLERVHYLVGYIREAFKAFIDKRVNLKGFFIWSFLDNFEWRSGYNESFGIIKVDSDCNRTFKLSAMVVKEMIQFQSQRS